jgi:hypothetical protein
VSATVAEARELALLRCTELFARRAGAELPNEVLSELVALCVATAAAALPSAEQCGPTSELSHSRAAVVGHQPRVLPIDSPVRSAHLRLLRAVLRSASAWWAAERATRSDEVMEALETVLEMGAHHQHQHHHQRQRQEQLQIQQQRGRPHHPAAHTANANHLDDNNSGGRLPELIHEAKLLLDVLSEDPEPLELWSL